MYVIHFFGIPLPQRWAWRAHTAQFGIATLNFFWRWPGFTLRYVRCRP